KKWVVRVRRFRAASPAIVGPRPSKRTEGGPWTITRCCCGRERGGGYLPVARYPGNGGLADGTGHPSNPGEGAGAGVSRLQHRGERRAIAGVFFQVSRSWFDSVPLFAARRPERGGAPHLPAKC